MRAVATRARRPPPKRRKAKPAKPAAAPPVSAALAAMDRYIQGILSGRTVVSEMTRLSVKRHVDDLARVGKDPSFPFYFDAAKADRAIRFSSHFRHVKGDLAGQPFDLVDCEWGLFFTASVHGWRAPGGGRRFRKALAWLPRGNAKSTVLSVNSNYAAFGEGGQADVYSLATTKEQAGITWGDSASMFRSSPELRDALGVELYTTAMVQPSTNSIYKRLASRDTTLDGLNVSWATLDELHEVTRALWDVIETALGKRANSILATISTAGMAAASFGRDMYVYCRQILSREVIDEQTFVLIYECPEGMDPYSEAAQRAANPMYGKSVRPEILRAAADKARAMPGARAAYLVKFMNIWVTSAEAAFDMKRFDLAADPGLRPENLTGARCIMGLDLASRHAFADVVKLFLKDLPHSDPERAATGETERHYYLFADHFINETTVRESANDAYRGWAATGLPTLHVTHGNITDYGFIRNQVLNDWEAFGVQEIATDQYEAGQLSQSFGDASLPMVIVPQRVQYLSPPLKEAIALVTAGRLHHTGCPILRWMFGNVVAQEDAKENLFPTKAGGHGSENYIDGVSAFLNALSRAMGIGEDTERPVESYLSDGDMVIA